MEEQQADNLIKESEIILSHPELINTNEQLIELVRLNLKAMDMDDEEKYPHLLIIATFLIKIGGSFNIEPLEILEGLKNQIDEWSS